MATKGERPETERRIHVLPTKLLERVRAYQTTMGLPSEVEAVRRLLTEALQGRDTLEDLMRQVCISFNAEKDLRRVSRQILSDHILVKRIEISDYELKFSLRNLDAGSINKSGEMKTGTESEDGWMRIENTWPEPKPLGYRGGGSSWEVEKGQASDLDDEIPF